MSKTSKISKQPLILFDGVCNLCNGSVQAVIKRDPEKIFRFASLQSDLGQQLLHELALDPKTFNSVILIHNQIVHFKSDAVLKIVYLMGGWGKLLIIFRIIPRFMRDLVYDWIASNRYRWFGREDECLIPTPELKDRFLN